VPNDENEKSISSPKETKEDENKDSVKENETEIDVKKEEKEISEKTARLAERVTRRKP